MESEEIAREHQLILDLAKSNKRRIDNLEEEQKELLEKFASLHDFGAGKPLDNIKIMDTAVHSGAAVLQLSAVALPVQ